MVDEQQDQINEEKYKVMLISRRKRKELKEIEVYLNNKPLEQVNTLKYLRIIIDNKFKFSEHISYAPERRRKTNSQLIQIGQSFMGPQT